MRRFRLAAPLLVALLLWQAGWGASAAACQMPTSVHAGQQDAHGDGVPAASHPAGGAEDGSAGHHGHAPANGSAAPHGGHHGTHPDRGNPAPPSPPCPVAGGCLAVGPTMAAPVLAEPPAVERAVAPLRAPTRLPSAPEAAPEPPPPRLTRVS
jgi:hypothetical protein